MGRRTTAVALGALLTAGGALASETLRNRHALPEESVNLDRVPLEIGGCEGVTVEIAQRQRDMLRSDGLLLREYWCGDEPPLWLFIDYHRTQRLGAQIHSPRNCYPGAGWPVTRVEYVVLHVAGKQLPACWLTLMNQEGRRRLVLYWYETRWGVSSRETDLKIDLLRSSFARHPTDAVLVRLSADPIGDDLAECRARIERFLEVVAPHLAAELPFARARA